MVFQWGLTDSLSARFLSPSFAYVQVAQYLWAFLQHYLYVDLRTPLLQFGGRTRVDAEVGTARTINRLSHRKVETLKQVGTHSDGGGLYLEVTVGSDGTPRKSWLFRYAVAGRERQMGLGPRSDVPLARARDRALAAREMRRGGKDPLAE